MEPRPSKALPVVLAAVMLAVFFSGMLVGMKLAPQQALAAAPPAAPASMQGCVMQMPAGGSCAMMAGGAAGDEAAESQASGGCGMNKHAAAKSGGCPMNMERNDRRPMTSSAKSPQKVEPEAKAGQSSAKSAVYTCPMHPEVKSSKPGQCPKCHMDLVKKTS